MTLTFMNCWGKFSENNYENILISNFIVSASCKLCFYYCKFFSPNLTLFLLLFVVSVLSVLLWFTIYRFFLLPCVHLQSTYIIKSFNIYFVIPNFYSATVQSTLNPTENRVENDTKKQIKKRHNNNIDTDVKYSKMSEQKETRKWQATSKQDETEDESYDHHH